MIPSSWQWRAHIPSPDVELEATSGSPEDYDDRDGYLPNFLGDRSDFLVPLPLLKGPKRPRSGRASTEGKTI